MSQIFRKLTGTGLWRILFGTVLALTAGLVFRGMLEICGTTNRLLYAYFIAAAILALAAVVSGLIFSRARV